MERNSKLKLFISYSHSDEKPYVEDFKKHIAPLKSAGTIEEWYDRKILPGDDYESKIDNNLENADVICLLISANFLSSQACITEKIKALNLRKKKGIPVIPLILSHCGWKDDNDIGTLLALPTDGKPISNFSNQDEAWFNVYKGLKRVIEKEQKIRRLSITEEFSNFLEEVELLTKSHSRKETVLLSDIFVSPEFDKFNKMGEIEESVSLDGLLDITLTHKNVVIAGEDLSGRTTICKMLYKELRKLNFIPVYVADKNKFLGKMENKILKALSQQYKNLEQHEIMELKERIIPIVDDFHTAKHKEKHIEYLRPYSYCILVVDDVFSLNITNEELITDFSYFKIKEFKPSLRHELIKKWVRLSDKKDEDIDYKTLDQRTQLVDEILGKNIRKGIFPSYPFFILSAVVTYETSIPLDQEITSQGYCYQAVIYFYLRKQGVKNEEIDIYINFLTEIAFYFYNEKKYELSRNEFYIFMDSYLRKYYLPIDQNILLRNLSQIIAVDSFGNYSFRYPYLYYFFVAKYFVEHIEDEKVKRELEKVLTNLQVDENAYIAVFTIHHTKNINILDEIERNTSFLFKKYSPVSLTENEVSFFDENMDKIVKASLPPPTTSPERVRAEILKIQDEVEQSQKDLKENKDEYDPLEKDLRRSIRTVEVMGCILKSRVGSIEKIKIRRLFKEAMNVHFRILSAFFQLIKNEETQNSVISFLLKILDNIIEDMEKEKKKVTVKDLEEIARRIFWNMNFFVVCWYIHKIVRSLGSDKLVGVIDEIYKEVSNPAVFLVKHGILMWYRKNLQINEIKERIKETNFSEIARRVLKFMIVNYCSMHPINYKDRQRIESLLGIPAKKLLTSDKDKL